LICQKGINFVGINDMKSTHSTKLESRQILTYYEEALFEGAEQIFIEGGRVNWNIYFRPDAEWMDIEIEIESVALQWDVDGYHKETEHKFSDVKIEQIQVQSLDFQFSISEIEIDFKDETLEIKL